VEDLYKSREPMPHMSGALQRQPQTALGVSPLLTLRLPAIYFISPSERSVRQLIDDFASPSAAPLYRKAHVFFSNRALARDLVALLALTRPQRLRSGC